VILAKALLVGILFAAGTYLVLQRNLTRVVLGFGLWGYAVNVLLLVAGGRAGAPPLVSDAEPAGGYADPLPQAMALTAIVITFAVTAFLLALAFRMWTLAGSDEVEDDIEDRRIARERAAEEAAGEAETGDVTEFGEGSR
jgi:multicomponent Na+:H+ antiporter subunit C